MFIFLNVLNIPTSKYIIIHLINEFGLIPNSNLPTLRKFLEKDIDFGKT